MQKNLHEFLPKRHPAKQVFAHHQIPVAAVVRYRRLTENVWPPNALGRGRTLVVLHSDDGNHPSVANN